MSPREPMGGFEDGDERPLAAEFVLGLVQGEEREALERRRRDDYVFAQEVEFWEAKLGPIANEAAAVEPPPHVWEAIAAEVGHKPVPLAAFSVAEEPRVGPVEFARLLARPRHRDERPCRRVPGFAAAHPLRAARRAWSRRSA